LTSEGRDKVKSFRIVVEDSTVSIREKVIAAESQEAAILKAEGQDWFRWDEVDRSCCCEVRVELCERVG
jgi:hypothetical protein